MTCTFTWQTVSHEVQGWKPRVMPGVFAEGLEQTLAAEVKLAAPTEAEVKFGALVGVELIEIFSCEESHTLEVSVCPPGRTSGPDHSQEVAVEDLCTSVRERHHHQLRASRASSLTAALVHRHVLVVLEHGAALLVPI